MFTFYITGVVILVIALLIEFIFIKNPIPTWKLQNKAQNRRDVILLIAVLIFSWISILAAIGIWIKEKKEEKNKQQLKEKEQDIQKRIEQVRERFQEKIENKEK